MKVLNIVFKCLVDYYIVLLIFLYIYILLIIIYNYLMYNLFTFYILAFKHVSILFGHIFVIIVI